MAIVLWSAAGCTGHATLSSSLSKVCPGTAVQLSWKTDGKARLNLEPTPPDATAHCLTVKRTSQLTFHPRVDTLAQLTVERMFSRPVSAQWSIDVWSADTVAPLWLTATFDDEKHAPTCKDGLLSAIVTASGFDADMRAGVLSAHPGVDRVYTVQHAGLTASLAPGASSDAFGNASIDGEWRLETRLRDGESCASDTLPRNLTVGIQPTCATGAP